MAPNNKLYKHELPTAHTFYQHAIHTSRSRYLLLPCHVGAHNHPPPRRHKPAQRHRAPPDAPKNIAPQYLCPAGKRRHFGTHISQILFAPVSAVWECEGVQRYESSGDNFVGGGGGME
ncbi:hypothetical protein CDAR_103381 [Caerostris darwini]|uniref:Uncharacterized protein n=1 Tax=Caerostris darwini TaxID=1538125 RepID=A0AAV4WBR0_9ARAC|nr:hypothetical protein CDAR_103381 [Caerostris darwini]